MMLTPYEYPVDRVIKDSDGYLALNPNLPLDEIKELQDSGLSTDEDGETITDTIDPEIPYGFHVIDAEDPSFFYPELDY